MEQDTGTEHVLMIVRMELLNMWNVIWGVVKVINIEILCSIIYACMYVYACTYHASNLVHC